ncbi:MAG: hypothetical protein ACRDKT_05740 [Actinomycetota bacterium]
MGRRRRIAGVAVACLLAAACGSTVPVQEQEAAEAAAEQGLTDGLAVDGTGGTVVGDDGSLGTGTGGASGSIVSGSGPASVDGSSGSVATGGGVTAPGENGPGVTDTTIKVGIMYTADYDQANAAIGAGAATGIDMRRANEAMFDYINKERGGIGGRKAEIVFHPYRVLSSSSSDQQDQEACAHWTQDDPVFISDGALKTENGVACLEKAGTVMIASNGLRFKSGAFFERYPHYIEFDGIDNDDISTMYVDSMVKLGYFSKDAKIGLLTWDNPEFSRPMQQTLIPRLAKYGLEPTDVAYIKYPESNDEVGESVAQVGNTAVRFKGEGITHVMFLDSGANLAFFFMPAAERQEYRPRYGLTTQSGNTALADLLRSGGNDRDARNQLHGAVSVGWSPTLDARAEDIPAWGNPPAKKRCYAIMREAGVEMDSANARGIAEGICDTAFTMEATLEASGEVLNQDTFLAGLNKVGPDDVEPTSGMGFAIGAARHDGTAYAAHMRFYDKCICFRYISDRFAVPD